MKKIFAIQNILNAAMTTAYVGWLALIVYVLFIR